MIIMIRTRYPIRSLRWLHLKYTREIVLYTFNYASELCHTSKRVWMSERWKFLVNKMHTWRAESISEVVQCDSETHCIGNKIGSRISHFSECCSYALNSSHINLMRRWVRCDFFLFIFFPFRNYFVRYCEIKSKRWILSIFHLMNLFVTIREFYFIIFRCYQCHCYQNVRPDIFKFPFFYIL